MAKNNYIQTLQEENKNLALKVANILIELNDFAAFLQTSPKFQGTENGERKDWISTIDVVNRIQEIKQII